MTSLGAELGPLLASALLMGLVGSTHCLAMCGGLAAAIGQAAPTDRRGAILARATVYSTGRITSYAVAGAIAGGLGHAFGVSSGLGMGLRVAAGLLVIAFGLHVAGWWNGLSTLERVGLRLWRRLAPLHRRIGRPDALGRVFLLGLLWGWLPCGLVYAALVAAAASSRVASGALFMLAFGVGTLPALLAASGMGLQLAARLRRGATRRAAGVVLLLFGAWSVAAVVLPRHAGHASPPAHVADAGYAAHSGHPSDAGHASHSGHPSDAGHASHAGHPSDAGHASHAGQASVAGPAPHDPPASHDAHPPVHAEPRPAGEPGSR
ncbi:MAG: sulfite exporter TauE/SafE family protein [Spirochaetaceae bacterium]|nr:sulfite exporter TauE/SafE family protein [Spirochaetaceae bacterium]